MRDRPRRSAAAEDGRPARLDRADAHRRRPPEVSSAPPSPARPVRPVGDRTASAIGSAAYGRSRRTDRTPFTRPARRPPAPPPRSGRTPAVAAAPGFAASARTPPTDPPVPRRPVVTGRRRPARPRDRRSRPIRPVVPGAAPSTGGRRLDHVAVEDGHVETRVEVASPGRNKSAPRHAKSAFATQTDHSYGHPTAGFSTFVRAVTTSSVVISRRVT